MKSYLHSQVCMGGGFWDQKPCKECTWHLSVPGMALIQFNVLHRLHFSNFKFSKMFPDLDSNCDTGQPAPASLVHTLWQCPSLLIFWSSIFKTLYDVLKTVIHPTDHSLLEVASSTELNSLAERGDAASKT